MRKKYIKIVQGHFVMYLISLSVMELIKNTKVEYYDAATGSGYQRQLIPSHYRKIAKYFQEEKMPIMPPAILTAVDLAEIEEDGEYINIKTLLNIVDGQHRIEGIKYLEKIDKESFAEIESYEFPVVMMVIQKNTKIHEVNTFININSKGKKVSTDLAIQLRETLRDDYSLFTTVNNNDFIESVATRVSNSINEMVGSVWYHAIRNGDERGKGRPVSINAFNQSLYPVIESLNISVNSIERVEQIEKIVKYITKLIDDIWKSVYEKWPECFENSLIKYSTRHNIQKGIGVYSLHLVLEDVIRTSKDVDKIKDEFKDTLLNSNVRSFEWIIGGRFSSFNSKAGFQTIAKYIKNEETVISYNY